MTQSTAMSNVEIERLATGGQRPEVRADIEAQVASPNTKLATRGLNFFYGSFRALNDVTLAIPAQRITAIIGPSGCGKSTLIRVFNRMYDLVPGTRVEGDILLDGEDVTGRDVDVISLRQRVGMVFQKPNPFPMSIYNNVAYGPRILGRTEGLDERVERSLRAAALWDEVKDRLGNSALGLSGGQQQRLVIARVIAVEPDVILMDEPASALDPIATLKIEELMRELKENYTIAIVTHNMQQAARISDHTAFMMMGPERYGELVEFGTTADIFNRPRDRTDRGLHHGAVRVSVRTQFEAELGELHATTLRMGAMVETAIKDSVQSLVRRDREMADAVVRHDAELNDMHRNLREQIFVLIATQQPVARDLRLVLGIQYIAVELERIGDYAVRIAKRVMQLVDFPQTEPLVELQQMAELVERQVHDILDTLVRLDAAAATAVAERDHEVDRLYQRIFGEEISTMAIRPHTAMAAQLLINIAHTLERIGDRVINIAEDIVFLDSGQVVELNEPV